MAAGLLLIAHGSPEPEAQRSAADLVAWLTRRLAGVPVAVGYLEHQRPAVAEAAAALAAAGVRRAGILPLLLLAGGHRTRDVPALYAAIQGQHPGVHWVAARGLDPGPLLLRALTDALTAAAGQAAAGPVQGGPPQVAGARGVPKVSRAILLVGRGTSVPEGQRAFCALAEAFAAAVREPVVPCFAAVGQPTLAEAAERCVAEGAAEVWVLPYLLFPGAVLRQVRQTRIRLSRTYPGVRWRLAGEEGVAALPRFRRYLLHLALALLDGGREESGAPACALGVSGAPRERRSQD